MRFSVSSIIYSTAIFLSAFLLFWIQPLISKQLTPVLGGSPMVWNTLLFFFQTMLLLGYGYISWVSRKLSINRFLTLHALISLLVLFFLPIEINLVKDIPETTFPFIWIAQIVFSNIGIPFFFLAATAPLLQIWYVLTFKDNDNKTTPYFLYAISNIGSFSALFLFLFLIEPHWGTTQQFKIWSYLIMVLIALVLACNINLFLKSKAQPAITTKNNTVTKPIRWKLRIMWLLMAFVPASLLHGVTFYITNDLFSLPLLWLIPLGLYLLTFVITFTEKGAKYHNIFVKLSIPAVFVPLILTFWIDPLYSLALLFLHIVMFIILCLACHGQLYKMKPQHNNQLGSFYLWLAAGGALAGFFNVVIAPLIFDTIFEYPISIALGLFLVLSQNKAVYTSKTRHYLISIITPLLISALIIILYNQIDDFLKDRELFDISQNFYNVVFLGIISFILIVYIYLLQKNALALSILTIFLYLVTATTTSHSLFGFNISPKQSLSGQKIVLIDRNFYGIIRIIEENRDGYQARNYYNGTIRHSSQNLEKPVAPFNYNPLNTISFIVKSAHNKNLPVAVLGMGPALYQCYASDKQKMEYFEINPEVIAMAENKELFSFLSNCPGDYSAIVGDARLQIEKEEDEKYGAILSSIYWSNTVPFHLFTKEAIEIYLSKLKPGGYLRFIMPKHFFDFTPLFAAYSKHFGIKVYSTYSNNIYGFSFVLHKPDDSKINNGFIPQNWKLIPMDKKIPIWTDDFYNIADLIYTKKNSEKIRYTRDPKRIK